MYWEHKKTFEVLIKLSQLINKDNNIFIGYKSNSISINNMLTIHYKDDVFKVKHNKKVLFESSNIELVASFVRSKIKC